MHEVRTRAEAIPVVRPLLPIEIYRAALQFRCAGFVGLSNKDIAQYISVAEKAIAGEIDSVPPRLLQILECAKFYCGLSSLNQLQFRRFVEKCSLANQYSSSIY